MTDVDLVGFERLARPLLELIQRLTGLETSFVTEIDWASQRQEVVFALNTSAALYRSQASGGGHAEAWAAYL